MFSTLGRDTGGLADQAHGFLALFMPYGLSQDGADAAFKLYADRGQTVAIAQDARNRLAAAGLKGEVTSRDRAVDIVVPAADRERVRTVLYDVVPDQVPLTTAEENQHEAGIFLDMRLGVALLLGLVLVAVAGAAGSPVLRRASAG